MLVGSPFNVLYRGIHNAKCININPELLQQV